MSPQSVVRKVDVSPVGGAERAGDDSLAPCLGDRRTVGRRHLHHKAAFRGVRVFQSGDEQPSRGDPDVVEGHV